jgi:hypothetical protein
MIPLALAVLLAAGPVRAASSIDSAISRLQNAPEPADRERACAELAAAPRADGRVYAVLSLAMNRDLSDQVRLAAAKIVITFPGDEPLARAKQFLLSEPGPQTRSGFAAALSTEPVHREDAIATQLISGLLADDVSPQVRRAAALGLVRRGDMSALPALRRAAENDADRSAREAACAAVKALTAARPAKARTGPYKPKEPSPDAVKGKDPCPSPWGWCECSGPIKREPKCRLRPECREMYNTLLEIGIPCTWDGLEIVPRN